MLATSMWCSTPSRAERVLTLALARALLAWSPLWLAATGAMAPGTSACAETAPWTAPPTTTATTTTLTAPATSHPQLAGSRLQGAATLRYFGLRIYHASLWTLPGFRAERPGDQPLVLELQYLRDLQGAAIAARSVQEMRRATDFVEARAGAWATQLQNLFPDVQAGDRISGLYQPGQGASFWLNGRALGRVDDPDLARLFFGIWLAPTSSQPEMRQALLGITASSSR